MPYNGEDNKRLCRWQGLLLQWRQLEAAQTRALARAAKNNFKKATHTRRCSSTTTQTIWVAVVTSPTLTARWAAYRVCSFRWGVRWGAQQHLEYALSFQWRIRWGDRIVLLWSEVLWSEVESLASMRSQRGKIFQCVKRIVMLFLICWNIQILQVWKLIWQKFVWLMNNLNCQQLSL